MHLFKAKQAKQSIIIKSLQNWIKQCQVIKKSLLLLRNQYLDDIHHPSIQLCTVQCLWDRLQFFFFPLFCLGRPATDNNLCRVLYKSIVLPPTGFKRYVWILPPISLVKAGRHARKPSFYSVFPLLFSILLQKTKKTLQS